MRLSRVMMSVDQIGSSGYSARVGEPVSLGLTLYSRRRSAAAADVVESPSGLVGTVAGQVRDSFYGGWVLVAGDIPFHVIDDEPIGEPTGGARLIVEGEVTVADDHVAHEVEQGWGLDLDRTWLVRRIVRATEAREEVAATSRDGHSYLLDLDTLLER